MIHSCLGNNTSGKMQSRNRAAGNSCSHKNGALYYFWGNSDIVAIKNFDSPAPDVQHKNKKETQNACIWNDPSVNLYTGDNINSGQKHRETN